MTRSATVQGMALLLQAKKNIVPNSGDISSGNPNIQFKLYRDWPSFHGDTRLPSTPDPSAPPPAPSPPPWDFKQTRLLGRFGQYLAVFDGSAHYFTPPAALGNATPAFAASLYPPASQMGLPKTAWSSGLVEPAAKTKVDCPDDFAETLAQFIRGSAGEPFVPGVMSGTDHWSRFVNTMLGEAAKSDYTFLSRRTNITADTSRSSSICTFMAIQPLVKLAIMRAVQQYIPGNDQIGLPDFRREPYFHRLASESSGFIRDMHEMDERLRISLNERDKPPPRPEEPGLTRGDGGGHVPILSIATSGPQPLWHDPRN